MRINYLFGRRKIAIIVSTLILFLSILFNFFSIENILLKVYKWHIVQPETVQGGLELIVVFLIIYLFMRLNVGRFKHIIIPIVILYLQLHQVLLPALSALLYLEIIISLGFLVINKLSRLDMKLSLEFFLYSFIVGFVTWCSFAIVLSLFGFGGFLQLRIFTLIVGIISLYKKNNPPLSYFIYKRALVSGNWIKLMFSFTSIMILTQLAKTNRALDYDSLWYGLRPEQVLVGPHSFFDNLNLVMAVHYYPKLFEMFTIPLGNLNDYSFILSGNIMLYVMVLIVVYLFARHVTDKREFGALAVALLGSVPAIANMASTAKTDIFSTLFIVCSAFYLWRWIENRRFSLLSIALACAVISLGGKITSLMYIPLLLLGIFFVYLFNGLNEKKWNLVSDFDEKKLSAYTLSSSIFVVCLICYRTLKLTGYPFYPIMGNLWNMLGFKVKYPFVESANDFMLSDKADLSKLWFNILFNPSTYTHYVMVWPSNVYLYIWILGLVLFLYYRGKATNKILLLGFIPVIASSIYYISTFPQGGDGNYYIPVVIFSVIAFLMMINKLTNYIKKIICISLMLFVPIQSTIMLVSHFSWSYGTDKFSINLIKSDFDSISYKKELFEREGVYKLAEYLSKNNTSKNCISLLKTDGQEQTLNQLPCRYEDIPHMNSRYGNAELFQSEDAFKKYLEWANVDTIILPNEESSDSFESVKRVTNALEQSNKTVKIEDAKFYLLRINQDDVSAIKGIADPVKAPLYLHGWYPEEDNYRWIAKSAEVLFNIDRTASLNIKGVVPDVFKEIELKVLINGKYINYWTLNKGEFEIDIDKIIPVNQDVNVEILLDRSFIPKDLNLNNDIRELGIIIKDITLK